MKKQFWGLGKDVALYGIMSGISQATGLILLPLFTRVFSVDEYGVIDIIAALTVLASMIGRLALPNALLRYYHDISEKEERKTMVSTLGAFMLLFGGSLFLLALTFSGPLAELVFSGSGYQPFLILGLTSAFFDVAAKIPSVVLRAERRIIQYNLLSVFYSLFYAPVALYLVFGLSSGVLGVFTGSAVANFMVFCISAFWARKHFVLRFSTVWLRRSLRYSLPLYLGVLVSTINGQANRFILLTLVGLGSVGLFGAASKIAYIVSVATSVFSQAWLPYTMSQIKTALTAQYRFFAHALRFFAGGFAVICLGLTAFSPEIFRVLVSEEFFPAYAIIPWMVGGEVLRTTTDITGMGVILSERTAAKSFAAVSFTVLGILLSMLLVPLWGITGAVIGTFTASLWYTAVQGYFTYRYSDIRFNLPVLLAILLEYVLAVVLLLWVSRAFAGLESFLIRSGLFLLAGLLIARQVLDRETRAALKSFIDLVRFSLVKYFGKGGGVVENLEK